MLVPSRVVVVLSRVAAVLSRVVVQHLHQMMWVHDGSRRHLAAWRPWMW